MSRFLSKEAQRLAPYTPGEQPQDQQYIKLNTNESPFPPSPKVLEAVSQAETAKLMLYSDPTCGALNAAIARRYNVKPEQVIATNGSDELLYFAFLAFSDENHPIALPDITYGYYDLFAAAHGIPLTRVPLKADFTIDYRDYLGIGQTIVFPNPNAPTGYVLPLWQVAPT